MEGFSKQREGVMAIDGKVLRRSFDKASAQPAGSIVVIHLGSVFDIGWLCAGLR